MNDHTPGETSCEQGDDSLKGHFGPSAMNILAGILLWFMLTGLFVIAHLTNPSSDLSTLIWLCAITSSLILPALIYVSKCRCEVYEHRLVIHTPFRKREFPMADIESVGGFGLHGYFIIEFKDGTEVWMFARFAEEDKLASMVWKLSHPGDDGFDLLMELSERATREMEERSRPDADSAP